MAHALRTPLYGAKRTPTNAEKLPEVERKHRNGQGDRCPSPNGSEPETYRNMRETFRL